MNIYALPTDSEDQRENFEALKARYEKAKSHRDFWEIHWQECFDYAMPQRSGFTRVQTPGDRRTEKLYDATAVDAVDQLAASLLGNLTPAWSPWFGFKPGPELDPQAAQSLAPVLQDIAKTVQAHFDNSNFAVEMHQAFLDLVVGGTASLCFEESEPGSLSAFKFTAVPLSQIVLEEGENGFLDGSFRNLPLTLAQLQNRYPLVELPLDVLREGERDPQTRFNVLESVLPKDGVYDFTSLLLDQSQPFILQEGRFADSPVISFRWLKSPGEIYGRSPVMKALPDIKTVNKVVELILKNASIAVTGIWQADDDGVLNPANIELKPGSIIPKAVGSQGLRPLQMPGNFDVSELVLTDMRSRIRTALLNDKLGQVNGPRMTATEVLERSREMALLLGATYGRLQSELLTPLIMRAFNILKRRGEIPDVRIDGRNIVLDYLSPLARSQRESSVQNTLSWISSVQSMGSEAVSAVDMFKAAQYLGEALGVPADLIRKQIEIPQLQIQEGENV